MESNSFSFSKNSFNPCDSLNFFFILFVIHELKLDFQAWDFCSYYLQNAGSRMACNYFQAPLFQSIMKFTVFYTGLFKQTIALWSELFGSWRVRGSGQDYTSVVRRTIRISLLLEWESLAFSRTLYLLSSAHCLLICPFYKIEIIEKLWWGSGVCCPFL